MLFKFNLVKSYIYFSCFIDQIFGMPLKLSSGKWKFFREKVLNLYNQAINLRIKNTWLFLISKFTSNRKSNCVHGTRGFKQIFDM